MLDHAKFIKIMMLSTSDADGEALAALRKANGMLKAAKMNWEELLKGRTASQEARYDGFGDIFREGPPNRTRKPQWRTNANGNWCKRVPGQGFATVFRDKRSSLYKWVQDGQFSNGFHSADAAMADFDGKD